MQTRSLGVALRDRARDPIFWNDVTQLVKTALAAVLAWVLASAVLELPQSFLAPWAALLVVHATVYRTFSRGVRQVSAAVLGVTLAWAIGNLLGLDTWAVAVLLLIGLALGALPWFGEDGTSLAATGLVVLTTGFAGNDPMLAYRLLDTSIGIVVGLAVNLIVWPPLRRRTAIEAMDRIDDAIGALLVDVADGLEAGCVDEDVTAWIDRTRALDGDLDEAWSLVRHARESARMNPRRSAAEVRNPKRWYRLLRRMEQAIAESRSMLRTLGHERSSRDDWEEPFRTRWVRLLREAGQAISDADPDRIVELWGELDELVDQLGALEPRPRLWPVYGALAINLRNVLDAMDDVAEANPLGRPPLPLSAVRLSRLRGEASA